MSRTSGILGSEGQVVGLRVEGSTVMRKGLLGSNIRILEWRVEWFDLRYTEAIRESVHSAGRYWWLVKGGSWVTQYMGTYGL